MPADNFERWSSHFDAHVDIAVAGRTLTLQQQPASDHVGQSVWDVARAMTSLFERGFMSRETRAHRRFVEVGAGLGLLGMAVAMLGGRVVLTDTAEITPALRANVARNAAVLPTDHDGTASASLAVRELEWDDPASVAALSPPVDVVLGTDVVYYSELVDPLVRTLAALADERTQVVIVNERRSPRVHEAFLRAMAAEFKFQRLDMGAVAAQFDVSVFEGYVFRRRRRGPAA